MSNDAEYFDQICLIVFIPLLWLLMSHSYSDRTTPSTLLPSMWEHNTPSKEIMQSRTKQPPGCLPLFGNFFGFLLCCLFMIQEMVTEQVQALGVA